MSANSTDALGQAWCPPCPVSRWLLWLVAALGGVSFFLLMVHGIAMTLYPQQVDYGEGYLLQMMETLRSGQPLYRDPQQYPWLATLYTPFYIWLGACLQSVVGTGFGAGRLISLLAAVGCVVLVSAAAVRRGDRWAGVVAFSLFSCSPLVIQWGGMCRVDFLGLLLDLAGLTLVDCHLSARPPEGRPRSLHRIVLASCCFALAFWTKQSFVLGFGAALLTLLLLRAFGATLALLVGMTMAVAIPYVLLDSSCGGRLYGLLIGSHIMPWTLSMALLWLRGYLVVVALPTLMAVCWLVRGYGRAPLWGTYLVLGFLLLAAGGRVGNYYNHFLPFQAAVSIVCGLALGDFHRKRTEAGGRTAVAALVGAGVLLHFVLAFSRPLPPTLPPVYDYLLAEAPVTLGGRLGLIVERSWGEIDELRRALEPYPGPLVAENLGPAVLIGRPAVLCDPMSLFLMGQYGRWDAEPFRQMVRERRLAAILLQKPDSANIRFPPDMIALIRQHYVPLRRVGSDWILVPAPSGGGTASQRPEGHGDSASVPSQGKDGRP